MSYAATVAFLAAQVALLQQPFDANDETARHALESQDRGGHRISARDAERVVENVTRLRDAYYQRMFTQQALDFAANQASQVASNAGTREQQRQLKDQQISTLIADPRLVSVGDIDNLPDSDLESLADLLVQTLGESPLNSWLEQYKQAKTRSAQAQRYVEMLRNVLGDNVKKALDTNLPLSEDSPLLDQLQQLTQASRQLSSTIAAKPAIFNRVYPSEHTNEPERDEMATDDFIILNKS